MASEKNRGELRREKLTKRLEGATASLQWNWQHDLTRSIGDMRIGKNQQEKCSVYGVSHECCVLKVAYVLSEERPQFVLRLQFGILGYN